MAAARYNASMIFLPFLVLLLIATAGFFVVFLGGVMHAVSTDPQSVAGPAQIVGAATPAQDAASVGAEAKPLTESEEARPLPEGQAPQAQ